MIADRIISVGVEPALSIDVDGHFGVVCLGSQGRFCTSCRHPTSFMHISYLKKYIENCSQDQVLSSRSSLTLKCQATKPQV